MKMMLAENIRAFRKDRSLTQEQLSEALGVTAGAVYKWEAKLSIPELELIIQMADFFDTSVDVLLGYEVKDNRLEATVKRLQTAAARIGRGLRRRKRRSRSIRTPFRSSTRAPRCTVRLALTAGTRPCFIARWSFWSSPVCC